MSIKVLLCIVGLITLSSCAKQSPQPFDSKKWLAGDASVRGSMLRDIKDRRLLAGKTKSEVEQKLGKPDVELNEWVWGYKIVTLPRCRFLPCGIEVGFDPSTGRASGNVSVSD